MQYERNKINQRKTLKYFKLIWSKLTADNQIIRLKAQKEKLLTDE